MKKVLLFLIVSVLALSACKKEPVVLNGSVMLYTTVDETVAYALKQDFEKTYPGIVLDYYYGDSDRVDRKIDMEFESGQANADVVFLSNVLSLEDMKSKSRLEAYESKESKKINKNFKDSDNFYCAGAVTTMGIAFNKNPELGIDEKVAPKTWNDFLNNDFRGKMGIANPKNDNYVKYWVMAMMQNKDYGDTFFRRLRDYGVVIKSIERDVLDNVVGATFNVGLCYDETAVSFTKEYEDFGFKYASADNITMPTGVALIKDAVNSENGKLFIDYLLSKKGQEILVANGLVSARTDVKNILNTKAVIDKSLKVDLEDIKKNGNQYLSIFGDIFGD